MVRRWVREKWKKVKEKRKLIKKGGKEVRE